jgi:hypothetical protein
MQVSLARVSTPFALSDFRRSRFLQWWRLTACRCAERVVKELISELVPPVILDTLQPTRLPSRSLGPIRSEMKLTAQFPLTSIHRAQVIAVRMQRSYHVCMTPLC